MLVSDGNSHMLGAENAEKLKEIIKECFACLRRRIREVGLGYTVPTDILALVDEALISTRDIAERGVTDKNITWPLTIWLMDQIDEKISRIFGKPTPDGIHQFKQDLFAAIRERGVTCEKCESLTDMNEQLIKRLQPEPPPASGYSLEQIEKMKLKVANALLRGSTPFAIVIIDDLIRELKQLSPAEPKGEVVTVYLNTLEHYNQCDNSITTVEMEYDDTPETFKQIHRFCPEEGELIKACMTLTQIREGDDE